MPVLPMTDTIASQGPSLGAAVPRDGLVRVQTAGLSFRGDPGGPAVGRRGGYRRRAGGAGRKDGGENCGGRSGPREADLRRGFAAADRARCRRWSHAPASGSTSTPSHRAKICGWPASAFPIAAASKGMRARGPARGHRRPLGALAMAISRPLPPSDPRWRGAPSSRFVDHARSLSKNAADDRPCRCDDHLRGAGIGPTVSRCDSRSPPCCGCRQGGLASRRRRPSGSASPVAAKAWRHRRSPA